MMAGKLLAGVKRAGGGSDITPWKELTYSSVDQAFEPALSAYSSIRADAILFRPDGLMFYVYGGHQASSGRAFIMSYSLSIAFDLESTLTQIDDIDLNVDSLEITDAAFSPDGSRFYTGDDSSTTGIIQYSLSTPWDVSTLTRQGKFATNRSDMISFNKSGDQLYLFLSSSVYAYSLSVPYDILVSTPSYLGSVNISHVFLPGFTTATNAMLSPDGTNLIVNFGNPEDLIEQYTLTTPYDFSTIVRTEDMYSGLYSSLSKVASTENYWFGFVTSESYGYDINRLPFLDKGSGYAINNMRYVSSCNTPYDSYLGLDFSDDGMTAYHGYNDLLYVYDLVVPYTLYQGSFGTLSYTTYSVYTNLTDFKFSPDGMYLFSVSSDSTTVKVHELTVPYDLREWFTTATKEFVGTITNLRTVDISLDGTQIYVGSGDYIIHYEMATPWDLSTAVKIREVDMQTILGISIYIYGLRFDKTGNRIYIANYNNIIQADLSTPFDLTTSVHAYTIDTTATNSNRNITLDPTGLILSIQSTTNKKIYQYRL